MRGSLPYSLCPFVLGTEWVKKTMSKCLNFTGCFIKIWFLKCNHIYIYPLFDVEDQPEEMETDEFEGDQIDTEETGDKTTAPDDEQIDTGNDEEEGEELGDEEDVEGTEDDKKQDLGEGPEVSD